MNLIKYEAKHKNEILKIWEESVLVTHKFLSIEDFKFYKSFLLDFDFSSLSTFCVEINSKIIGFLAVHENKLEMLFIHPDYFGSGLGKKLMQFAIKELHVRELDVNEQNKKAVDFYLSFGFRIKSRSAKDAFGRKYPILTMELNK